MEAVLDHAFAWDAARFDDWHVLQHCACFDSAAVEIEERSGDGLREAKHNLSSWAVSLLTAGYRSQLLVSCDHSVHWHCQHIVVRACEILFSGVEDRSRSR
jgi:hypothetical protein